MKPLLYLSLLVSIASMASGVVIVSNSTVPSPVTFVASQTAPTSSSGSIVNLIPATHESPNPAWAPALDDFGVQSSWVEFVPSGMPVATYSTGNPGDPGFVVVPNGTTVTYILSFPLVSGTLATLNVLADDTTGITLTNTSGTTTIATAVTTPGATCAPAPVGCLNPTTEGSFPLSLLPGINTIAFTVQQINAVSFGLDWELNIPNDTFENPIGTPEPATFALIGGGLLGVALIRRRKSS